MLPASVVERLNKARAEAFALRVDGDADAGANESAETVDVWGIRNEAVRRGFKVELSHFSAGEVRVVLPQDLAPMGDWVAVVGGGKSTTEHSAVLLCSTRDVLGKGKRVVEVTGRIQGLLAPGQRLEFGRAVDSYLWISCGVGTPEDPFFRVAQAA